MRDSTIIYRSFYEAIRELPKPEQAEAWEAVYEYVFNDNTVEMKGTVKMVFMLIKPQLDANNKRYANGKKGGKPKSHEIVIPLNHIAEPNPNPPITKPKPNKNKKENGNDNKKDLLPSLKIQLEKFKESHPDKYTDDMYNEFYRYRNEPFIRGQKLGKAKWEGLETWSLAGRLATWKSKPFNNQTSKLGPPIKSPPKKKLTEQDFWDWVETSIKTSRALKKVFIVSWKQLLDSIFDLLLLKHRKKKMLPKAINT